MSLELLKKCVLMDAPEAVKLVFLQGFTEREASEARDRGYLSHVLVEVGSEQLDPVVFYDAVRLQHDLELNAQNGRGPSSPIRA